MSLTLSAFIFLTLTLSAITISSQAALAQGFEKLTIEDIYYFGCTGQDLAKIKSTMPVHAGDKYKDMTTYHDATLQIKKCVEAASGRPSTDEALVLNDKRHIIFIGLPGTNNYETQVRPAPDGKQKADPALHKLYNELMEANVRQLQSGAAIDKEQYSLISRQIRQAAQLQTDALMDVLANAGDKQERLVAANALGQAAHTRAQIDALGRAASDNDATVRNNAVRALAVLLIDHKVPAAWIDAGTFVDLLNSPTWSDRNKGMALIEGLLQSADLSVDASARTSVDNLIKSRALDSIKEMCLWPRDYSEGARMVLQKIEH